MPPFPFVAQLNGLIYYLHVGRRKSLNEQLKARTSAPDTRVVAGREPGGGHIFGPN